MGFDAPCQHGLQLLLDLLQCIQRRNPNQGTMIPGSIACRYRLDLLQGFQRSNPNQGTMLPASTACRYCLDLLQVPSLYIWDCNFT